MANENKNADVCLIRGIVRHNQIMPQVAKASFADKRRVPSAVSEACLRRQPKGDFAKKGDASDRAIVRDIINGKTS